MNKVKLGENLSKESKSVILGLKNKGANTVKIVKDLSLREYIGVTLIFTAVTSHAIVSILAIISCIK